MNLLFAAPPVYRRCVSEGELIVFGLAHDWMMADGDENRSLAATIWPLSGIYYARMLGNGPLLDFITGFEFGHNSLANGHGSWRFQILVLVGRNEGMKATVKTGGKHFLLTSRI